MMREQGENVGFAQMRVEKKGRESNVPQEKKIVDKFKLIETIGVMQKALEDDVIDIGKISFAKMPSGFFNVTVVYHEIEHDKKTTG